MSARMVTEWTKVRAALVGLAAIGVLMAAAVNFQRLPLVGGGETYRAEFTDASGLVAGEEVRVAGIKVGQVNDIELAGNKVVVTFTVRDVRLGKETTAGIEVKTLLGQHYLSLSPAGDGELNEGTIIPLARTTTPLNIVPAFQRLSGQLDHIDTKQVAEAFDALSETLEVTEPQATETLRGLSRLSLSISQRDDDIRELFRSADQVSGVVADRDRELGQLLTRTDQVLQMLARRREVITAIVRDTRILATQLRALVRDNESSLKPTLQKLNAVLEILVANREHIDATVKYGFSYAREFTAVGGTGRWFDSLVKYPNGMALCTTDAGDRAVTDLIDSVLSPINQAGTGSSNECLPLGPPTGEPQ